VTQERGRQSCKHAALVRYGPAPADIRPRPDEVAEDGRGFDVAADPTAAGRPGIRHDARRVTSRRTAHRRQPARAGQHGCSMTSRCGGETLESWGPASWKRPDDPRVIADDHKVVRAGLELTAVLENGDSRSRRGGRRKRRAGTRSGRESRRRACSPVARLDSRRARRDERGGLDRSRPRMTS